MSPSNFWDLFRPNRGDLMYGRREQRDIYADEFRRRTGNPLPPDSWWTIDQYNNTWGLQMGYQDEAEMLAATSHPDPGHAGASPFRPEDYRHAMEGVPRRDPRDLFQHHGVDEIIHREGWDVEAPVGFEEVFRDTQIRGALGYKQIRRACKFGVEFVVATHQRMGAGGPLIHFILDGLDDDHVLAKNKVTVNAAYHVNAVPITSSELRNVYRNWANPAFRSAIKFYRGFVESDPPWVTNPGPWQAYGQSRMAKLERELRNMINDPRLHPFRMEVIELMGQASIACNRARQAADFNAAAFHLRAAQDHLIGLMNHTVAPKSCADIIRDAEGRDLKAYVRSALARYDKRGLLSWRSKETKNAMQVLRRLLAGNAVTLLGAVHYYMDLEPALARMGAAGQLGERLSGTGRFSELIEEDYRAFRFGGEPLLRP